MPISWNEIRDRATRFAREWQDASYERGEAQSFWNEFFAVFGVQRSRVYSFEKRVEKLGGHAGYIDCFWPGVLIAEHKSRGKPLDKAHLQALDYLDGLKDRELPRYIIVSDFEFLRLYDLHDDQMHEVPTAELPKHVRLFGFIAGYQTQEIRPENPVNVKAAERMGKLHDQLKVNGYDGHDLEVFLVRLLFCMFADDTGIFQPPHAFEEWIEQRSNEDGSDLGMMLARLFQVLNTPEHKRVKNIDEQLGQFPYVNGQLFEETIRIADFDSAMREALLNACALDWSAISPAIFGAMFQSIMDKEARRNLGAHYTSEQNIEKLIRPLFLDELWAEFERVKNNKNKLFDFHKKLRTLTFLDPACGCGNFLVVTYRALRELELEVLRASISQHQLSLDILGLLQIDVDQFYGIEIEEFPVRIAEVALWLTDHQMNLKVSEEFGQYFARIPLSTTPNIHHGNALRMDWEDVIVKERLNYILGNPPFGGKHYQSKEQRIDQMLVTENIKSGSDLDFVACWFLKAADFIKATNIAFAFVATNSITQGEQVPLLWAHLLAEGMCIKFAHRTFKWTNEARGKAAVHCVIIGIKQSNCINPLLFDYETPTGLPIVSKASIISPYLTDGQAIFVTKKQKPITDVPIMRCGNKPTDGGNLLLTASEAQELVEAEPGAKKYIKRIVGSKEFLNNTLRYCLWLKGISPKELRALPKVLDRVNRVREFRLNSSAKPTRIAAERPAEFFYVNQPSNEYILIPEVSSERRKYIPIGWMTPDVISTNKNYLVSEASKYLFGLMQSTMHMAWIRVVSGRLKSDFQYSATMVYNNFPWPQNVSDKQCEAIEAAAQAVLDARELFPDASLADLYDPLTMPPELLKAHKALDRAVDRAYSRKTFSGDADRVAFLFELYQKLTSLLPAEKKKKRRRKT